MHMQNNFTVQVSFRRATTIKAYMVIVFLWLLQNLPRERERKKGGQPLYLLFCFMYSSTNAFEGGGIVALPVDLSSQYT